MSKIYIVGIGPGHKDLMTEAAQKAILESDVIIGYTLYVDLIKDIFPNKCFSSTPMMQEIQRCKMCFEEALNNKTVSLICSGDAGVYGMASPMYELIQENDAYKNIDIEVISGITAANSGASILGAPLNHDYCVISLSDLMTPWNVIEKRLIAAIQGDFSIAIYNPSSHKRKDYLKKACEIMLNAGALKNRACGFVENIGREGTASTVCTLEELMCINVNMFTTVFIGNSQSFILETKNGKKLITKRGYKI